MRATVGVVSATFGTVWRGGGIPLGGGGGGQPLTSTANCNSNGFITASPGSPTVPSIVTSSFDRRWLHHLAAALLFKRRPARGAYSHTNGDRRWSAGQRWWQGGPNADRPVVDAGVSPTAVGVLTDGG